MWGYDTSRMWCFFSKWLIPQETMDSKRKNMFAPTRTFAIEITHPNIIYSLAIRSDFDFRFQDLGFKVVGFRVSLFCEHIQIDKISKHNQPFLGPNSSSNDLTNSPDGPLVLSPGLWIASGFMLVASPFFWCVCVHMIYIHTYNMYRYTVYTYIPFSWYRYTSYQIQELA